MDSSGLLLEDNRLTSVASEAASPLSVDEAAAGVGAGAGAETGSSSPVALVDRGELILIVLLVALILISVVGNCLVCVAIFTDRRLRKLGNAFIVSLAIADLFVSCLVMTFALCNDLMNRWIFGDWFCDVWISFDIMCCTASILNLCAISLDRFIHIKDCLLYNQWMTRKVAISAVIIIWFISALVSFVPINLGWHKPATQATQAMSSFIGSPLDALTNNSSSGLARVSRESAWMSSSSSSSSSSRGSRSRSRSRSDAIEGENMEEEASTPTTWPALVPNYKLNYPVWAAGSSEPIENQSSLAATVELELKEKLAAAEWLRLPQQHKPEPIATSVNRRQERRRNADFLSSLGAGSSHRVVARSSSEQSNQVEFNPQDGSQIGLLAREHKLSSRTSTAPAQTLPPQPNPLPLIPVEQQQQQAIGVAQCVLTLTPTYAVISSTISFCIPCIIMLGLYTKLFACARKHVRNIQAISKAPAPLLLPPQPPEDTGSLLAQSAVTLAQSQQQQQQPKQQQVDVNTEAPVPAGPAGARTSWLKLASRQPQQIHIHIEAETETETETERSAPHSAQRQPDAATQQACQSSSHSSSNRSACLQDERKPFLRQASLKHLSPTATQLSGSHFQQPQSGQLATHKAAVTLGIIMGTFLFCWVPFFCLNIIKAFCVDCIPSSLFRAFTWLGYANSALNPIIYGIHNTEFRNAFNRIFFKHLNIKNSRYYINRRLSYDLRHNSTNNNNTNNNIIASNNNFNPNRAYKIDTKLSTCKSKKSLT